mgnify:CR=1 FL=1
MRNSLQKRTWAEVSLDNISHNYRAIRAALPEGCRFLGVVKADAYGHGAVAVARLLEKWGRITAVGTTSVRTLESLTALAWRIRTAGTPDAERVVGQWELYDVPAEFSGREALETLLKYMDEKGLERIKAATQIMITPLGYEFRIVRNIVTNFHQPKSTLLLLVSAFVGGDWKRIYEYALGHGFRFLSYGDSSVLMR